MVIDLGKPETEQAFLVGLARDSAHKHEVARSLDELERLALSAGAGVVGRRIQVRPRPDPACFIGRGLVDELPGLLEQHGGNCVIFDDALAPAQQRNLENRLQVKVIDRPILILDIFASRARTHAARLQVELAQLEYTLPRLTGAWVHLSRQYGGLGAKGPGETQLETDRRQVRQKIATLKRRLERLGRQRSIQRSRRGDLFKVALVGYTNAGKSTLFNLLTKAQVHTADMLFTTLDSTTRRLSTQFPSRIVISDTVGFIRKLPHQLVASFKSTLEEVCTADLLLHVVDCTDPRLEDVIEQTNQVLAEIGADQIPYLLIYNKIDSCPEFVPPPDLGASYTISALQRHGVASLQAELIARSQPLPAV